jgi:hypothetical protein
MVALVDPDHDVPLVDDASLPVLVMDTATIVRGGPRPARLRWLAAFSALIALAGGIVVVARHGREADPHAVLAKAQAAVADAGSYRFDLRTTTHVSSGDPAGAGSDTTSRSVDHGEVAAKDRWRVVEEDSYGDGTTPFETRRIGDHLYVSGGDDPADVGVGPAWDVVVVPDRQPTASDYAKQYADDEAAQPGAGEDDDPEYRLDSLLSAYMLPVGDDPANVERLVRKASQPIVEEHLADGGLRLRTQLDPLPEFQKVAKHPIPPVEATVDLAPSGLPTAVRFSVAVKGASEAIEATFRDWGADVAVEAPAEADIDHTPWIEEENLASVDPSILVAPTTVPGGLELASAYVYAYQDDGPKGTDCRSVDLSYSSHTVDPFAGKAPDEVDVDAANAYYDSLPYVDVTISRAACDSDDTPFDQQLAGHASRNLGDGYVEVQVGPAIVAVSSALSDAQLEALVGALRPTTPEALAAQVPQWAKDDATQSGGWFGGPTGFVSTTSVINSGG